MEARAENPIASFAAFKTYVRLRLVSKTKSLTQWIVLFTLNGSPGSDQTYDSTCRGQLNNNILACPDRLANNIKKNKSLERQAFTKKAMRGYAKPDTFLRALRAATQKRSWLGAVSDDFDYTCKCSNKFFELNGKPMSKWIEVIRGQPMQFKRLFKAVLTSREANCKAHGSYQVFSAERYCVAV